MEFFFRLNSTVEHLTFDRVDIGDEELEALSTILRGIDFFKRIFKFLFRESKYSFIFCLGLSYYYRRSKTYYGYVKKIVYSIFIMNKVRR